MVKEKARYYIALGQHKGVMWTLRVNGIRMECTGVLNGVPQNVRAHPYDRYVCTLAQDLDEAIRKAVEFTGQPANMIEIEGSPEYQNKRGERNFFPYNGTFYFGKYNQQTPKKVYAKDPSYMEWYIRNAHTDSYRGRTLLAECEKIFGKTQQEFNDEMETARLLRKARQEEIAKENAELIEILQAVRQTFFINTAIDTLKTEHLINQSRKFQDIILDIASKFRPLVNGGKPLRRTSKEYDANYDYFENKYFGECE